MRDPLARANGSLSRANDSLARGNDSLARENDAQRWKYEFHAPITGAPGGGGVRVCAVRAPAGLPCAPPSRRGCAAAVNV